MTVLLRRDGALLTDAPSGIAKLRRLVRKLAVAGKLTAERGPGRDDGWRHAKFGDVFSLEYGENLPAPKRSGTGEFPVYGSNGVVGSHVNACVHSPCLVVGRKGSAGAVNVCEHDGCWVTDVAYYTVPPDGVTLRYAYLLFLTLGLDELGKGIKPGLSRSEAYVLPISIPPLAEQHRIVAKVDELMALCDRLEARQQDAEAAHVRLVQALLDSLSQARDADEFQACWQRVEEAFSTLFTTDGAIASLRRTILRCGVSGLLSRRLSSDRSTQDLLREISVSRGRLASAGRAWSLEDVPQASRADLAFEIPDAWAVVRAAEVCWPITSGSTPPASEMHESLGIPFLKVYNIRNQAIDFGYKPQFVSASYHDTKLRRSCLQPGDIVMNIVGPPLGKVAVVPDDFPEWNCNQAIVGFRLIPPMVPAFLYLYLCEGAFLQGIELIGTAGQDNISVTKSKHLPIPVPPIEEQHRIVAKVTELLALCDQLKAGIAAARAKHAQLAEALVVQAVTEPVGRNCSC